MRYVILLSLLILTLAACGPAQQEEDVSPLQTPASSESSEADQSPVQASPLEPSDPAGEAVKAAKSYLVEELDLSPNLISVAKVEAVNWSDASLGCAEPGKAYAQVVTPGYRILLEAEGEQYEVHTDEAGKNVVFCD
jgi:uncharacterized protein involved in copper resistance